MMAEAGTLSFDQVNLQSRQPKSIGKLKLAAGGAAWKETATGQVITLPAADFNALALIKAVRGYQLRIILKDGSVHKFDGITTGSIEELQDFIQQQYGLALEVRELSVKGWNWGKADIDGNHLEFKSTDKLVFDLPLTEVTNVVAVGKDEIALEFAQPETVRDKKTDTLVELRLYVPEQDDDQEDKDQTEASMNDEEDPSQKGTAASKLAEKIKEFSQLNAAATGDIIASLPELPCIVPRGRFQLDMGSTHLRLHGKSYDHKILFSSIVKLFLLPKLDDTHILFVLALDPPIRQGQTRYPFLVFQFDKDEEMQIDLKNIDEDTIRTKYEGKLQMSYDAPTFEVVSTLFRLLAGQKIIVPGSFRGATDGNCLKCAMKANEGFLYPLERNFLFLPKPVTLLPHADISHVEFSRVGAGLGNPRSFDIKFYMKSGGQDVSFSNIAKEEQLNFEQFLTQKGIQFHSKDPETSGKAHSKKSKESYDYDEDEEDKEDDFIDDEEEEKGRGAKRSHDEDDSSPDEDYQASDEDDSSVDEEYDEDYNSSNEDDD